ncbi:MAG: aminoacyl-tRNA hydrolase [Chloroflexi bacterium]|nr:aminoacyl-tRNA hydrolase [Chloroflexota bacterium]MCL5075332.1 aminoacyl-tRNA hydrolase [Chloroflexota bacterium]
MYAHNRHNIGFRCVELLARRHELRFTLKRARSLISEGRIGGTRVVLAKPQTFMNLSGRAVQGLMQCYKSDPAALLVVHDDLDLSLGKIRIRPGGSAGGHNGVQSIIDHLGTEEFARLRLGIGRSAEGEPSDYVLSDFMPEERPVVEEMLARAMEAIEYLWEHGITAAMNRFN